MKTIYLSILLVLFITSTAAYSQTKGSNISYSGGHDSLLFDGANLSSFNYVDYNKDCHWKVSKVKGLVKGVVLKQELSGCRGQDTIYSRKEKMLDENDILVGGSEIRVAGGKSMVAVAVFLAGDTKHIGQDFINVYGPSVIVLPSLEETCEKLKLRQEERRLNAIMVNITMGKVLYNTDNKPSLNIKTVGKNASAKHTKTKYSHEVKIDGNDTIDVIRVYEGSVEVTYQKTDAYEEEAIAKEMEKLSEDLSTGKITAIEYSSKMTEFQSYIVRKLELSKPVTVDEGNKCTVTKKSRTVEPLGAGDEDR